MFRYEESQLHKSIYQLDVKLLGADGKTVIKQHTYNPEENLECYSHTWKKVANTHIHIYIDKYFIFMWPHDVCLCV